MAAGRHYMGILYLPYPASRWYEMTAGPSEHVWGASRAADRVWAEVSGFGPSKARGRLLMNLQAVIDDSYDPDGVFVLAGYIASGEAWSEFSREWEELLPLVPPNRSGVRRFKMAQMAASADRMANVPASIA